jgi:integrase
MVRASSLSVDRQPASSDEAIWAQVVAAFLEERSARTGSRRTVETYERLIRRFVSTVPGLGAATPLSVHSFAYGPSAGGHQPAPSTVLTRLAAIGGLYAFAVRMGVVDKDPAAAVRRPTVRLGRPRGLTTTEIRRLLAVIPDTPVGLLDRALILTAILTGLRRSELVGLRIARPTGNSSIYYEVRTKGGTLRRRELPAPAWTAIVAAAEAGAPVTPGPDSRAFGISDSTLAAHLGRYATQAGLDGVTCHALRHTAAKLRREAGASIEDVSSLLGHRSVATTATYLRRLEDEEDRGWEPVARVLGLEGMPVLAGRRATAEPQERSRPDQVTREGGWWNSRSPIRRGVSDAPLPRPDPTVPRPQGGRRRDRRRAARARPSRPRRVGSDSFVPALQRPTRALDGRIALAGETAGRRR